MKKLISKAAATEVIVVRLDDKQFSKLASVISDAISKSLRSTSSRHIAESSAASHAAYELEMAYPNWAEIVGACDVSKDQEPDPDNPFRQWLSKMSPAYQKRVNNTNSAKVLMKAIADFEDSKATRQ